MGTYFHQPGHTGKWRRDVDKLENGKEKWPEPKTHRQVLMTCISCHRNKFSLDQVKFQLHLNLFPTWIQVTELVLETFPVLCFHSTGKDGAAEKSIFPSWQNHLLVAKKGFRVGLAHGQWRLYKCILTVWKRELTWTVAGSRLQSCLEERDLGFVQWKMLESLKEDISKPFLQVSFQSKATMQTISFHDKIVWLVLKTTIQSIACT